MTTWSDLSLLLLLLEWTIRLVMLPVVAQRRRPSSAMAWLLIIFFEPVAGLILYLLIGENQLPQRRIRKHAKLMTTMRQLAARFVNHPNIVHPELELPAAQVVSLAERLSELPILGGNKVELMSRTEDFIDHLIADIDAATQHVHLMFYIFAADTTGQRVANALRAAEKRGVRCRVLIDAVGSWSMLGGISSWLTGSGVELHVMLPVNPFRRRMARIDLRNHRKVAVIDGRIAYSGSQNIVDANYGHRNLVWHDMMARLTGPVVLELQIVFLTDWYFETDTILDGDDLFPDPVLCGDVPVQVLPSGPSYPTENYQRLVVAALYAAQRHVVITTPYFVPDEPLMQAVQVAVMRGVVVDFILPDKLDQLIVGAAARAYYEDLLDCGAKLHLYTKGLLHSKTITIDEGIAFLGSSNFDIRSFALNYELNLLIFGPQMTAQLREEQQKYLADSYQLTRAQWRKRPFVVRLIQNIARLLSPLL